MTTGSFYRTVMNVSEEMDEAVVRRAVAAVFHALRDDLAPDATAQVRARLPPELADVWDEAPAGERRAPEREQFYARVANDGGLASLGEARWLTLAVFAALGSLLSAGESDEVLAVLPGDLKALWADAQRPRTDDSPAPRTGPVRVQDVMSPDPVTIGPSAALRTARMTMIDHEIRHLPVVGDGRRLMGIITDRDLRSAAVAPALLEHLSGCARRRLRSATAPLEQLQVRDVMTWPVVTTRRGAPVAEAAAIMHAGRFGSLPVVEDGVLVGIVTERDALRALAATLCPVRGADPDTYFW